MCICWTCCSGRMHVSCGSDFRLLSLLGKLRRISITVHECSCVLYRVVACFFTPSELQVQAIHGCRGGPLAVGLLLLASALRLAGSSPGLKDGLLLLLSLQCDPFLVIGAPNVGYFVLSIVQTTYIDTY